jgi:PAS domain S-box-containing protein
MSKDHSSEQGGKEDMGPEFAETLLATLPVPVFYKDPEGRYTGFNSAFLEFTGRCRAELLGKTVLETAPKEIAEKYKKMDDALLASGGLQVYDWKVKRGDGSMREVVYHKAVLRDGKGLVTGLVGAMMDVTERNQAERLLKESEEKLRATLESMDDLVFVFGPEGLLSEFYRTAHPRMITAGYPEPGRHYSEVLPPEVEVPMRVAEAGLRAAMKTQSLDFKAVVDGSVFWYNMRLSARRPLMEDFPA